MWKAQIDQALANAGSGSTGTFLKQVLGDYWVTDGEYQEFVTRVQTCMSDLGYDGVTINGYGTNVPWPEGMTTDNTGPAVDACELPLDMINNAYWGERFNPQDLQRYQLIRDCYQTRRVSDGQDLSDAQFRSMVYGIDGEYYPTTVAGVLCFEDPDGRLGLTEEWAQERLDWLASGSVFPYDKSTDATTASATSSASPSGG